MITPAIPRRLPHALDALGLREFRLLWFSSWLGYVARWMEIIVTADLVYRMTGSPFLTAVVGFCRSIPTVALGLFAGILADKVDRKRLLLAVQGVNLAVIGVLAVLALTETIALWQVILITLTMGVGWVSDYPSRRSLVLDIVGRERITNAIALDASAMVGSKMAGPALGGLLIWLVGAGGAFAVMAACYLGSLALLSLLRPPPVRGARAPRQPVFSALVEGMRYARSRPVLWGALLVTVVANLFIFPYIVLVPVLARDVLGVGPVLMGLLGAAEGMGSLVGTLFVASLGNITRHGRVFAFGTLAAAVSLSVFGFSHWYPLSLALLLATGVCLAGFASMQSTIFLLGSPDHLRGRVFGTLMLAIGMNPVGMLYLGFLSSHFGAANGVATNALTAVALMLVVLALVSPLWREPTAPPSRVSGQQGTSS
ncbi:MAG: MFS transporter [Chloroflexi bacterium]|nr:MFS transporter [Chloroflexota bacterium]